MYSHRLRVLSSDRALGRGHCIVEGQVKMAVWDYFYGAMVTFYTVEPSKVGGDIDAYMHSRGFVG